MSLLRDRFVLIIFFATLLIRLPFYHAEFWRSPDAIEYLNVAQNIAQGQGLTKNIKWHYFDTYPITSSAYTGRPILTSIIFSAVLKINKDPYTVQIFLFLLGSLNAVLSYLLLKKFFSKSIAVIGALLFALNPNNVIVNRMLLSEPIFTTISLCGFLALLKFGNSLKKSLFLGLVAGFAYLTRIEGLALLFVFLLFYIRKPKYLLAIVIGFIIIIAPYYFAIFNVTHLLFYSYNSFHLRVHQFAEGMWEGYGKTFPTSSEFIRNNFVWIVNSVFHLTLDNLSTIFKLGSVGSLSVLYFFVKKEFWKKYWIYLVYSFLIILFPSVVWSMFGEPERHYSTIYPFLIIPILSVALNKKLHKIFILVVAITFVIYLGFDVHRITWAKTEEIQTDSWNNLHREKVFEWIDKNTSKDSNISAPSPWLMNYYTSRPSALLPTNLKNDNLLQKYIGEYHIDYFVVEDKNYADFFEKKLKLKYTAENVWIFSTK